MAACLLASGIAGAVTASERVALFGDLHVHNGNSPDAFIFGVRFTPDAAFRYARGGLLGHPAGHATHIRQPPDCVAVTDHAEYMGVLPMLAAGDQRVASHPAAADLAGYAGGPLPATVEALLRTMAGRPVRQLVEPQLLSSIWQGDVEAADRHYAPGSFSTLIGFEYTSSGGDVADGSAVNLHRNVFVCGNRVPQRPFSSFDSRDPRDLWRWMEGQRADGIEMRAIPDNPNLSDGLMLPIESALDGSALDREFAELSARNEPLVEITQIKASSETHPALSPDDEWAAFEILDEKLGGRGARSRPEGSYLRRALIDGLALERRLGVNPYRYGVVGASDSHNASQQHEEDHYSGRIGLLDGTPATRRKGSDISSSHHLLWSAAGLTGVWAEANTREAIHDAMRRLEVFATSGPRIRLQSFGGSDYEATMLAHDRWPAEAERRGGAMGRDLRPGHDAAASRFAV